MNVTIIGTGYVGLATGAVLSEVGHIVTCLDIDEKKIATLQTGKSPIYEPGLDEMIERNMARNRLNFTINAKDAYRNSEIIIIAVGTPQGENGAANLVYIEQAAKDIAAAIKHNVIVVVKSTVPVGTNDLIEKIIRQNVQYGLRIEVVSNPEFLREGYAIHDSFHGDRIIIGAENKEAGDTVEALYNKIRVPILRTNRRSAEMIKYASNAFLAVKISYINQISNLCEKVDADISAVADGMGMDHRIGRAFLNAGLGYGGSCFPKDTEALIYLAHEHNVSMSIVESASDANKKQRQLFVSKVLEHFNENILNKKIAILGLAFKPNTDDMREAPSVDIIKALSSKGATISVYDPVIKHTSLLKGIDLEYAPSLDDCVMNAEAALLITEWDEFVNADWNRLKSLMHSDLIFDGRSVLKQKVMISI